MVNGGIGKQNRKQESETERKGRHELRMHNKIVISDLLLVQVKGSPKIEILLEYLPPFQCVLFFFL